MMQTAGADGTDANQSPITLFAELLSPRAVERTFQKSVGLVDNLTPRELVLAHGLEPLWIEPPTGTSTVSADVHLEARFPERDRALLSQVLDGQLKDLALLILGRQHSKLYYYLTEFRRRGMGMNFPPIHQFDLIPQHDESVAKYNALQIMRLREALERASGVIASATDLRETIHRRNKVRDRLRQVQNLRWQARLSGTEGLAAMAVSYWMSDQDYVAWVDATLLGDRPASAITGSGKRAPRVVVAPHASLRDLRLHGLTEDAGLRIVGENDWVGSQAATCDMAEAGDPIEAILRHSWRETFSHDSLPRDVRHAWLKREVMARDVDGVLFHIPPEDQMFGWDYPDLRNWFEKAGKKTLLIDADIDNDSGRLAAAEMLRNWTKTFEPTGANAGSGGRQ